MLPRFSRLSGNHLKIIAALSMLLDHAGLMLFPGLKIFRILGRLALPIFAYMIAEGCRYTRNKKRYFLTVFSLAAVCQAVYFVASGSTYLSILVTFSMSILLIYIMQWYKKCRNLPAFLVLAAAVAACWLLNRVCTVDYGFWGCMLPVFAAALQDTPYDRIRCHVAMLGVGLVFLGLSLGGTQWYALLALPLLALYSGKRGKYKMKYFFYIFYPAHLVALQVISSLL